MWSSPDALISTPELTTAIETEFSAILPALQLTKFGQVVTLTHARLLGFVSLLPFFLHVLRPDAIRWLPLTAQVSVLPFSSADLEIASLPLFKVSEASAVRRVARSERYAEKRQLPRDLEPPDWEVGAERKHSRLDEVVLPACAFVCIQRVRSDGTVVSLPRPRLGRHAKRDAPCPSVMVPGGRFATMPAITALAAADLVIVDAQRLRGQRSLRTIRALLATRASGRPTLIVAASPSDLFAIGLEGPPDQLVLVGPTARIEEVTVVSVGHDRLAAEERFNASLPAFEGRSAETTRILTLARNAWWANRQAIDAAGGARELAIFERGLENFMREDPLTAGLFTTCRNMLHEVQADSAMRTERMLAVVEAVTRCRTAGGILVLTRSWRDTAALRAAVAAELNVSEADLEALGVWVRTVHAPPPSAPPDVGVLVGYAGMATIDAVVASGARRVRAVFDPVETRAAWYNAVRMTDYLARAKVAEAACPFSSLADGLAVHVAGFAPVHELELGTAPTGTDARSEGDGERPAPGETIVCLADGSRLEVPLGARFEVLGSKGFGSRVVPVTELKPGDQVVLLDEDAHALFSEQRIAALDAGVLKKQSQARAAWLAIVRAVAEKKKLTASAIADLITAQGPHVTSATVRQWLAEKPAAAHAPLRIETFLALAQVLGLQLPEETLRSYYREIHTWRLGHRRAGRQVARAIRLAYTGRLGAVSLARIERDWGVGVRALVDAAQVGVVDEVILPDPAVSSTAVGISRNVE